MSFSLGEMLKKKNVDNLSLDENPVPSDNVPMEQSIPNYSSLENINSNEVSSFIGDYHFEQSMPNYSSLNNMTNEPTVEPSNSIGNQLEQSIPSYSSFNDKNDANVRPSQSIAVGLTEKDQEPEMRSSARMLTDDCNVIDLFGSVDVEDKDNKQMDSPLQAQLSALQHENVTCKDEVERLSNIIVQLNQKNEFMKDELSEVHDKLQESLHREKMAAQYGPLSSDHTDKVALENAIQQLSECRERALRAEHSKDLLMSQVNQMGELREKLQCAEMEHQKATYQAQEWREKAGRLEAQNREELQIAKSNANYVMEDCTSKTRSLENQLADCNLRLSQAVDQGKSQERARLEIESEVFSLKCRLQDAQSDAARESKECNNIRRLLSECQTSLEREAAHFRGKVSTLEVDLSSANNRNRQLVAQLNSFTEREGSRGTEVQVLGEPPVAMRPTQPQPSRQPPAQPQQSHVSRQPHRLVTPPPNAYPDPAPVAATAVGTSSLAAFARGRWPPDQSAEADPSPTGTNASSLKPSLDRKHTNTSHSLTDANAYEQFYAQNNLGKVNELRLGVIDNASGGVAGSRGASSSSVGGSGSRSLASLLGKFSDDLPFTAPSTSNGTHGQPGSRPQFSDSMLPGSTPHQLPATSISEEKDNNEYNFNEQFPSRKQMSSNSPFATEQTNVDMSSFDQLEKQLTSYMSEKTNLGEEISRLHQRGGKTLKERTRLKQAESRLNDLSKEVGIIRRTLATKPN